MLSDDPRRARSDRQPAAATAYLRTYDHDIGLAWLWLAARRGTFGTLRGIRSERLLRSHDGSADGSASALGVRLGGVGPGGHGRMHYPDLLLLTASGHRVAVELELSRKGRTRRERILGGYAADPGIDVVLYLVDRESLGREIAAAAAKLGISRLVHVQRVSLRARPRSGGRARVAQRATAARPPEAVR